MSYVRVGAKERMERVRELADGVRSSSEIASILGENVKYVQKMLLRYDMPRRKPSEVPRHRNKSWAGGRSIDNDGYATVPTPDGHSGRKVGRIAEHRLVMEIHLGRCLLETEVVDHIDGLHLHNCPSNLRVFESNADHLKATISGQVPNWSERGKELLSLARRRIATAERLDTYRQRKARGDVRLQQILLAALRLGIDSPFLLGTHRHLEKAGIDWSSRSSLELALADLYRKYE